MLESKFAPGIKKNSEYNFSTFLTENNDSRLLEIAKDTIDFKENIWKDQTIKTNTLTAINKKTPKATQNNIELVDVLCNEYMYYLRNKTFHGDQADHSFRFIPYNKESKTLKFSSALLFLVICDLINNQNF